MTETWKVTLPWVRPPMNLNDRTGWQKRMRLTAETRHDAGWAIRGAKVPQLGWVEVALSYRPQVRRGRDADNLVASFKPIVDGMVDAGVVIDDRDEYVRRQMPVILPVLDRSDAGMWLLITKRHPPNGPAFPPTPGRT